MVVTGVRECGGLNLEDKKCEKILFKVFLKTLKANTFRHFLYFYTLYIEKSVNLCYKIIVST